MDEAEKKRRNAERAKAYREANKERVNAQKKAYREANKEKGALQHKARYEANKERALERHKAWHKANKDRVAARGKIYREANRELIARRRRKKIYGTDGVEMLERQEFKCGICGASIDYKTGHIDHCHDTGVVRGWLCGGCNIGIGSLKESPEILRKALAYVEMCEAFK